MVQDFGTVDGLINNAGITRDGLIARSKDGEIKKCPGQLAGCDRCQSHRVLPLRQGIFRETPGTEKARGLYQHFVTFPFWQYGSEQLYRDQGRGCRNDRYLGLRRWHASGIRVAAIAPGYINTEMTSAIREDVKQKIIDQIPLKRMGEPNEISHSVFYILENDYFTGRVIECDGGFRI